ncbi:MAG: sugar transferase [Clostridiales bacterium]
MYKSNNLAFINFTQSFLDIIVIFSAFFISYYIIDFLRDLREIYFYIWILIIFFPTWIITMNSNSMYNDATLKDNNMILKNVFKSTIISGITVVLLIYTAKIEGFSRSFMITFLLNVIVFAIIKQIACYKLIRSSKKSYKHVIVIGSPEMYKKFSSVISKTNIKIKIKGYISISNKQLLSNHIMLGKINNLENFIKEYTIDEIIFALPKNYVGEVEKYVVMCETMGITVRMIVDLFDLKLSKTHIANIGGLPFFTFHTVSLNPFQLLLKRFLDIMGAISGLTITSILGVFIFIAIKIDSKGPVLFSQKRVGLNGRIFDCYKFRSMYIDAEERKKELMKENEMKDNFMFKMKNDPRITKVGNFIRKTSLDELPQFWNVLRGEMSLVGTRPPTIDEVKLYKTGHRRRISIKPGITGLWQVNGRSSITDFEDVVKLDTSYIDNWSLMMDFKILLRTILVVFKVNNTAY